MAVRALTLKLAIPKLLKEEEKKRSKQKNEEKNTLGLVTRWSAQMETYL